jgi:hypothetical protein
MRLPAALLACCAVLCPVGAELGARAGEPASVDSSTGSAATLRVGVFVGMLNEQAFPQMLYEPGHADLASSYIAEVQAVRTLHRFASIPLDVELEGGVGKRFGEDHQTELDLLPMLRWKLFPWNRWLYTNLRLGLLGVSYASSVSSYERQSSKNDRGSRFLNLVIPELTFARSASSSTEFFVRVHHRSGIFGVIDGTHGGSSYVGAGFRFVLK